jgi:hypothetical protein
MASRSVTPFLQRLLLLARRQNGRKLFRMRDEFRIVAATNAD